MPDSLAATLNYAVSGDGGFTLDVGLEVPPGLTVLFGPSGSGKSTVLGLIAGLRRPASGRVQLGSNIWYDSGTGTDTPVHKRGISFVFQSAALFPHLSALGNVEYGISREMARSERRDRALHMLERMKVPHLAKRKPATFSGGEAQRVALARAFARSPSLVLLDEAFSALDRELRRSLGEDVRQLIGEAGIPGLLVTHHRMEALQLATRAILIRNGRIEGTGAIEELLPAGGGYFDDESGG